MPQKSFHRGRRSPANLGTLLVLWWDSQRDRRRDCRSGGLPSYYRARWIVTSSSPRAQAGRWPERPTSEGSDEWAGLWPASFQGLPVSFWPRLGLPWPLPHTSVDVDSCLPCSSGPWNRHCPFLPAQPVLFAHPGPRAHAISSPRPGPPMGPWNVQIGTSPHSLWGHLLSTHFLAYPGMASASQATTWPWPAIPGSSLLAATNFTPL